MSRTPRLPSKAETLPEIILEVDHWLLPTKLNLSIVGFPRALINIPPLVLRARLMMFTSYSNRILMWY